MYAHDGSCPNPCPGTMLTYGKATDWNYDYIELIGEN